MQPYYEYLEFKNLDIIQEKIMALLTARHGDFTGGSHVLPVDYELMASIIEIDELMDEIESRGWLRSLLFFTFFVIEPVSETGITWAGGGWPIHDDGKLFKSFLNDHRLVVPISNTAGTKTRFYTPDPGYTGESVNEKGSGKILYTTYDADKCTEVANYELTKPVIINTSIPHGIDGKDNGRHRISMGVNFNSKVKLM